jgi:hypothetical protein
LKNGPLKGHRPIPPPERGASAGTSPKAMAQAILGLCALWRFLAVEIREKWWFDGISIGFHGSVHEIS